VTRAGDAPASLCTRGSAGECRGEGQRYPGHSGGRQPPRRGLAGGLQPPCAEGRARRAREGPLADSVGPAASISRLLIPR
jgi:hypothetical protein